jgi:hypothetical protein
MVKSAGTVCSQRVAGGGGDQRQKVSGAMRKPCLENTQMHTRSNTHHIRTAPYSAHYYRIATPEPDPPPQEKFRQRRKFDRYLYDRKEKKKNYLHLRVI